MKRGHNGTFFLPFEAALREIGFSSTPLWVSFLSFSIPSPPHMRTSRSDRPQKAIERMAGHFGEDEKMIEAMVEMAIG